MSSRRLWRVLPTVALVTALAAGGTLAHERGLAEEVYLQGAFAPRFTPPAAGTYELPTIKRVESFPVLDRGRRVETQALMAGKIGVVSFIYTACSETLGCPLASEALRRVQDQVTHEGLRDRVALLSVTFDNVLDRASLDAYAQRFQADRALWRVVGAVSDRSLQAMLASYGQDRAKLYDDRGRFAGRYRHVLKVFLVDQHGAVRNIYSAGFLVPQVLVNDIKTLLGERGGDPGRNEGRD